jgi:hypothetical protein
MKTPKTQKTHGQIYALINKQTSKICYVGQHLYKLGDYNDYHNYKGSGKLIIEAFRNTPGGRRAFTKIILQDNITEKCEMDRLEYQYTEELNTLYPNGYNIYTGRKVNISKSTIEKMVDATREKMVKIKCLNTGVVYESLNAAAKALDLGAGNISHQVSGKYKHTGGYKFEYSE